MLKKDDIIWIKESVEKEKSRYGNYKGGDIGIVVRPPYTDFTGDDIIVVDFFDDGVDFYTDEDEYNYDTECRADYYVHPSEVTSCRIEELKNSELGEILW